MISYLLIKYRFILLIIYNGRSYKKAYQSYFGTAYEVYKEAVKKDNSIRLQDVKDYLNTRQDKQTQFKHKTYNT